MKPNNPELRIPASVALKTFNDLLGTNCKTLEETVAYLEEHLEERLRLQKLMSHRPRSESKKGRPKAK